MKREALQHALRTFARNPVAFWRLLRAFPTVVRLSWRVFWDRRVRWPPRLLLLATLAYVVSPVDLLPAAVFGPIGALDDLTVLALGAQAFLRWLPPSIVDEHVAALYTQAAAPPP